jgi:hypothetical protein
MYSVRFHLGRGPHYKFWQIKNLKDKSEAPLYLNPEKFQLYLYNCKLVCKESHAKKVFEAGIKDVCGWVQCETFGVYELEHNEPQSIEGFRRVYFNPIVDTNWRVEGYDNSFNNAHFEELLTSGSRVYLLEGAAV